MRRIAIDSNLLLLLIVGTTSRELIERHKRLREYSIDDFDLLLHWLGEAELITTPNVLTEVSNLADYGLHGKQRNHVFTVLSQYSQNLLAERYHQSRLAVTENEFQRLGLADTAWLCVLEPKTKLLTDDLDLYLAALYRGYESYNFNHLREQAGTI